VRQSRDNAEEESLLKSQPKKLNLLLRFEVLAAIIMLLQKSWVLCSVYLQVDADVSEKHLSPSSGAKVRRYGIRGLI
jgi:hypothetical protein